MGADIDTVKVQLLIPIPLYFPLQWIQVSEEKMYSVTQHFEEDYCGISLIM
jgi:hypothetical protein